MSTNETLSSGIQPARRSTKRKISSIHFLNKHTNTPNSFLADFICCPGPADLQFSEAHQLQDADFTKHSDKCMLLQLYGMLTNASTNASSHSRQACVSVSWLLCFAMSLPDDAKMLVLDPAWLPTSVAYCCQDDLSDLRWDTAYFYDKLREQGFENSRTAFKFYSWCEDVVSTCGSLFNAGSEIFKRGPQPRLGLSKPIMIVNYIP